MTDDEKVKIATNLATSFGGEPECEHDAALKGRMWRFPSCRAAIRFHEAAELHRLEVWSSVDLAGLVDP